MNLCTAQLFASLPSRQTRAPSARRQRHRPQRAPLPIRGRMLCAGHFDGHDPCVTYPSSSSMRHFEDIRRSARRPQLARNAVRYSVAPAAGLQHIYFRKSIIRTCAHLVTVPQSAAGASGGGPGNGGRAAGRPSSAFRRELRLNVNREGDCSGAGAPMSAAARQWQRHTEEEKHETPKDNGPTSGRP